ncbi:Selenocysteine lyase/Cysteine desulfurase [Pseudoxanthomonas sp. CF385]|uniref:aminotransferase class V-fold PLP-dependent enzyme n=1 Tax=Pseudoxanthomonas sp. CF385 TaxID=1881042 RepID=UPI00087F337F|nr:aminotransferase class V-fold PLP-dependent enzyme [Pseudoxanthomonas sp. CF385]SDR04300.1 Selenocysteine lyase/Cysteine desulfurase [Pseudoxanthomonas sp. CF385]
MALSRRHLLAAPAALAASALLPGPLLAAVAAQTPAPPDLSDWDAVRAQFALDPAYLHFASFFIASHPTPVREALDGYRRAMDANPFLFVERAMFEDDAHNLPLQVCTEVAEYLGGRANEVCLTRSTTEGLALVYHGLPLKAGDEVLTTVHDHYSHHESIRLATARAGATMRKIALFASSADAGVDEIVGNLKAAIQPATRVVGITWVHSSTGIRLPIREIAAMLRGLPDPPLLVVDGVHGLGAADDTVATMGADYFCAGTHKWMFAPRGTGLVWANAANWGRLRPLVPNFTEIESYNAWTEDRPPAGPANAARMMPGGFHAFEHQWAMTAAFRMHQQMQRPRVAARITALNDQLKRGLADLPKVKVHTPRAAALSAGLVAFEIDGMGPTDIVKQLLTRRIVASTSPYAISYARLAPSLVNTPAEVDEALRAVRALAT